MKPTTGLLLLLPLLLLVESSCLGSPAQRKLVEFVLKDGTKITCLAPRPDMITKGAKAGAEIAAAKMGTLLKGTGGASVDVERIRQEVPADGSAFEVIEYSMCVQYVNGVLSKEQYHSFTEQIIPAYKKNTPEKPVSDVSVVAQTSLAKTCEQSRVGLMRRPEEFIPEWRSVLNSFRKQTDTHDLLNLFRFRGPLSVGHEGKDYIREATFTLNCLEQIGELRMEKLGTTSTYWGENFANQMIIFKNP